MKIHRDICKASPFPHGSAVTIGNFDGVHRGHQAILQQLSQLARQQQCPAVVVLFEPQPQEFFAPQPPIRISNLREKCSYLQENGIENVVCLRFNRELAQMSASQFASQVLRSFLQAKSVLVGDDFRFGHKRQGDFAMLKMLGQELGFDTHQAKSLLWDQTPELRFVATKGEQAGSARISSTRIRAALAQADFATAEALLGHPFSMMGRVIHGQQLGRQLGFPTVNIAVKRQQVPCTGIFAVKVQGVDGKTYQGAASLGTRPAVNGQEMLLEVNIFDFAQQIYGTLLQIDFCHKIRDEEDYASLDLLKAQIARDVAQVRDYFND